jgi:Na+/proline symporter
LGKVDPTLTLIGLEESAASTRKEKPAIKKKTIQSIGVLVVEFLSILPSFSRLSVTMGCLHLTAAALISQQSPSCIFGLVWSLIG